MLYFSKWKALGILLVVAIGILATLPNVLPESIRAKIPSFLPSQPIVLGLDLQGGSHVLLEADREQLKEQLSKQLIGDIRQTLREQKIGYSGLGRSGDQVSVRITEASEMDKAYTELRKLSQPVSVGIFGQGGMASEFDVARDGDRIVFTFTQAGFDSKIGRAMQQSVEILERRINALGTTEPSIQREGLDRIVIQVPGLQDPTRLKELLGKTAKLQFRLLCDAQPTGVANERPPLECEELPDAKNPQEKYWVQTSSRATVDGEDLTDAQPAFDQRSNEPIVSFRFNQKGALRFGKLTQENVGRPFAIVLDNEVVSAPRINEPILGGQGQISGRFGQQEANDLAIMLRSGALPVQLQIVEERTVGPSLGRDSIRAGAIATIVATVFIAAFMVLCYGLLGVFADVALVANNLMMLGILSLLGATLTLPGIAGIVLSMGMAVDANVLIYERMREEARSGRSTISAIEAGFTRALATIIDAHLTALIAALALFALGSGPIRGFAVTLAIGIVSTLFTSYLFTRLIVATWVRRARPKALPRFPVRLVPDDTKLPFMKWAKYRTPVSLVLLVASFVLLFTVGLNQGIDFKGGTVIEVRSHAPVADLADIRAKVSGLELGDVEVQGIGESSDVLIRVAMQPGGEEAQQSAVEKVRGALGATDFDYRRVEVVGPRVSGELAWTGTMATVFTMVGIMLYIWFRFEWQFAIAAVATLFHDVVLTIGFFAVTQIDFNLSSIAAILTILGYSLNDTVVIFDRIREILRRHKTMPVSDIIDLATNQTLARTILTSLTLLLALLALFLFGGQVIRSFTAAMIFGVMVSTASSIFIGGPILIYFRIRPSGAEVEAAKPARA